MRTVLQTAPASESRAPHRKTIKPFASKWISQQRCATQTDKSPEGSQGNREHSPVPPIVQPRNDLHETSLAYRQGRRGLEAAQTCRGNTCGQQSAMALDQQTVANSQPWPLDRQSTCRTAAPGLLGCWGCWAAQSP